MNIRIQRLVIDPIKSHYDKVIVLLAFGLLIVTASTLIVDSGKRAKLLAERTKVVKDLHPQTPDVQPVLKNPYAAVRTALINPMQLAPCASNTTLLVPEERVSCPACRKPIPFGAKDCPFCSKPIDTVVTPEKDSDSDGMKDWYEIKYGLNSIDPSDANIDSDGDGYTNLQEFEAGEALNSEFNPKDKNSVPPAWWGGRLFVKGAKATEFNLMYMSSIKLGSNSWLFVVNELGGQSGVTTYSRKIGESVNEFKLIKHEEKYVSAVATGSTMTVKTDVSELTLLSPTTKLPVILVKGKQRSSVEKSADLYYIPGRNTLTVKEGEEFQIGVCKYRVKDIDAGGRKVLIFDPTFDREVWIEPASSDVVDPAGAASAGNDHETPTAAGSRPKPSTGRAGQPVIVPVEKK